MLFRSMGVNADYYIPDRSEGYGLNNDAVKRLNQGGYELIITIDNGISCFEQVELANSLGIDVIVTDHHEPPEKLPDAVAIINPKLEACTYPYPYLAGVGVSFKLCQALAGRIDSQELRQYVLEQIDLVTLGSIADIVPLLGENRIIAASGLEKIGSTNNIGLQALVEVCQLEDKKINSGDVGFKLGPRINAIGRLDNPIQGVELLTTKDRAQAKQLAEKLDRVNRKRQIVEERIFKEAVEMVEEDNLDQDYAIVLASEGWHAGVIGIVASKLQERYYRPTILIAIDGQLGKGSARGISGLHLFKSLVHCQEYLEGYGGHELAAGLSVKKDNIEDFKDAFIQYAREELTEDDLIPRLKVDARIELENINFDFLDELESLEPHGPSNPRPVLQVNQARHQYRLVGSNDEHLKVDIFDGKRKIDGIGFSMAGLVPILQENGKIDLVFNLKRNIWRNKEKLQLTVKDIKGARIDPVERLYKRAMKYLKNEEPKLRETWLLRRTKMTALKPNRLKQEIISELDINLTSEDEQIVEYIHQGNNFLAQFCQIDDKINLIYYITAFRALSSDNMTFIIYPTPKLVEYNYHKLRDRLNPLGISVFHGHGGLSLMNKQRLVKMLKDDEVDTLLITPQYLLYLLEKYPTLTDKIQLAFWDWDFPAEFDKLMKESFQKLPSTSKGVICSSNREVEKLNHLNLDNKVVKKGEKISLKYRVEDQRQLLKKESYLADLLDKGEKTIIFVNTAQKAVDLAQNIRARFLELEGEVGYYHHKLPYQEKRTVEELYQNGQLKVVITTLDLPLTDFDHLVFYHPHLNHFQLRAQINMIGKCNNNPRIHFLYNEYDKKINESIFMGIAPDRDTLKKIYIALTNVANRGQVKLKSERLDNYLVQIGLSGTSSPIFRAALNIFFELELIKLSSEGNHKITLQPKPARKLDLKSSIRYNEGITEKKVYNTFSKRILEEKVEILLKVIASDKI